MDTLPKGKYAVTTIGSEKLHNEFQQLENKRAEVAGNIRTAKAYGDLSENFEYHEAKREQGFLEGRIMQLKAILPSLHAIPSEAVPTEEVGFGSVVTVDEDGDEVDFFIVGPLEADPLADRISYESPLGAALIGKKVGETVEATVPAGKLIYVIRGIRAYAADEYTP